MYTCDTEITGSAAPVKPLMTLNLVSGVGCYHVLGKSRNCPRQAEPAREAVGYAAKDTAAQGVQAVDRCLPVACGKMCEEREMEGESLNKRNPYLTISRIRGLSRRC